MEEGLGLGVFRGIADLVWRDCGLDQNVGGYFPKIDFQLGGEGSCCR